MYKNVYKNQSKNVPSSLENKQQSDQEKNMATLRTSVKSLALFTISSLLSLTLITSKF